MTRTASRRAPSPGTCLLALALACAAMAPAPAHAAGTAAAHPAPASAHVTPPAARPAAKPVDSAAKLAQQARAIEELGGWARAAELMREVRGKTTPDPDLELMLAWCEARSGQLDSAWARMSRPMMLAAGDDSLPAMRWNPYPWDHDVLWLTGRFEGWHWYVWRTRAELAAALGRWDDALAAARRACAARPRSGSEWYIRGSCAAHTGAWDEAASCTRAALELDPTLPEAHHLAGLLAWRSGRRAEAQTSFRAAMALDSSYAEPALDLMRSRLPGAAPDSLPAELLHGVRRIGLFTAPETPKREVFIQDSSPASVLRRVVTADVDTTGITPPGQRRATLRLVVLVGPDGRAALVDVPPYEPNEISIEKVSRVVATLSQWRFRPAMRDGQPVPAWAGLELSLIP